jgi:VCBS repeat-containing protein
LGQGGFAEVYLGVHVHLGTPAALKLLHTQLATPREIELFRQEAQIVAALIHPHIVRVLDFDVEQGTPYLVLDYAPNGSLRGRLPAGTPYDPRVIQPVLSQVAEGLQYAHEQKLVHRDIKPENMLLGRNNEVLLGDFGIAVVAQNSSLQKTQGVAGTTAYMAPEQLQGKPRPASDIYSLGVVVYEWLTGERPFQGAPMEVASQHVLATPPPLRDKVPALPEALEQVVLTALAKDPKDRFGSARAFANAFAQACQAGVSSASYATLSTQAAALPASQGQGAISGASTQVPPGAAPPFPNPARTAVQIGQPTPSVFDATTHLTPPLAPPTPPQNSFGSVTAPTATGAGVAGASGWANQVTPAGPPPAQTWAGPPLGGQQVSGPPVTQGNAPTFANAPAPPVAPPRASEPAQRKGGTRRWALIVVAVVVALAAIGGGGVFAFTHLSGSNKPTGPIAATSATVTITPQSNDLKDAFTIAGVTGTPDTSKQVQARQLSITTQSYSQTVNATGQGSTPGTHARGTLAVINYNTSGSLNLPAGTVIPNTPGCQPGYGNLVMVLDAGVSLPASPSFNGTGAPGTSVQAHVQQVGSGGNFLRLLAAQNRTFSPQGGCGIFVYNGGVCNNNQFNICFDVYNATNFTGGTDPQVYTEVAQSDIDNAASSLEQANQPNAQQVLQSNLQAGEQLIGTPQCSPKISSDHRAGDQVKSVTVTVFFVCIGEAYNQAGALTLAQTLLTSEAQTKFGPTYALVGQIKTSQANATQDTQGNVTITVNAEGVWAYQFTDAQKAQLATLIVGKAKADALQLLMTQTGVAQVTIDLPGAAGQTLPTDPQKIMVVIQTVAGA